MYIIYCWSHGTRWSKHEGHSLCLCHHCKHKPFVNMVVSTSAACGMSLVLAAVTAHNGMQGLGIRPGTSSSQICCRISGLVCAYWVAAACKQALSCQPSRQTQKAIYRWRCNSYVYPWGCSSTVAFGAGDRCYCIYPGCLQHLS